jgi:hypothetical protein
MRFDSARSAKGALAGAVAAGVWAAQQPLDKRVFASRYDDVELLGKLVTRGPGWYPVGLALHVQSGALFGALYAAVARHVPLPGAARGVLAGLAENFGTWPLSQVTDRLHPARDELPRLSGNRRALWQSAWRHALFGAILGELERRLNGAEDEAVLSFESVASPNGHGDLERALAGAVPGPPASSGS